MPRNFRRFRVASSRARRQRTAILMPHPVRPARLRVRGTAHSWLCSSRECGLSRAADHGSRLTQAAQEVIERGSGTLFDPLVAAAFLRVSGETWETIAKQTVTVQASSVLAAEKIPIPST